MNKGEHFKEYFEKVADIVGKLDNKTMEVLANVLIECYNKNGTVYIMGNGGSGGTASHVCGDYSKAISMGLPKRFKIISLNDNMPGIMAIANDMSYDDIFVEQLKGGLTKNDVIIGISGSGNSINVVKALEYAKIQNVKTVAFTGFKGGKIKEIANISINVPIMDMEITEDVHLIIFHSIKQLIIKLLKGDNTSMGKTYDERIDN